MHEVVALDGRPVRFSISEIPANKLKDWHLSIFAVSILNIGNNLHKIIIIKYTYFKNKDYINYWHRLAVL